MYLDAKRTNHRLTNVNYRGRNCYFITLCTFNRRQHFRHAPTSRWLLALLRSESSRLFFVIHAYCLMPDHLHFLIEGIHPSSDLLHFVKRLKLKSSRVFVASLRQILWQKGFYDHILRPGDSVEDVAWYIWLNPVRSEIVQAPEEFANSGSFTQISMPKEWTKSAWQPPWKNSKKRPASEGGPYKSPS